MCHHFSMKVVSYVRYINIPILLKFVFNQLKLLSYSRKTEITNSKKGDNDVIIP